MQEIARYAEHRNHVYTQELLKSQVVQQLNNAWSEKRFADYIQLFDNNRSLQLPGSYKLKRKIAGKKL